MVAATANDKHALCVCVCDWERRLIRAGKPGEKYTSAAVDAEAGEGSYRRNFYYSDYAYCIGG